MQSIEYIDSHTAGEPTRVVIGGAPSLGSGSLDEQAARFGSDFDHYRSAVVNEPRGSDVLVGALLLEPSRPEAVAGVIFFNNVGPLGMCGHGTIGIMKTLEYLGRVKPGRHLIETRVGDVVTELHPDGRVSVQNVASYRKAKGVTVQVEGIGPIQGDVAWGGNWFFLVEHHPWTLSPDRVDELTDATWRIRQAVNSQGFPEVDHVELFAPSETAGSRNFVLCPGKAYDRSPCGTGTSAKLACLAADGKLAEGATWVQESILGTQFQGSFRNGGQPGQIIPTVTGTAFITGRGTLLLDEADPFRWGIRR